MLRIQFSANSSRFDRSTRNIIAAPKSTGLAIVALSKLQFGSEPIHKLSDLDTLARWDTKRGNHRHEVATTKSNCRI